MTTLEDIKFTGINFDLTDAIKELTTKKINKNIIKHYSKWISGTIEVIMKKTSDSDNPYVAEINVHVHDTTLNATAKTEDMYESVDDMLRKIEVQLEKFKGKHLGHQQ